MPSGIEVLYRSQCVDGQVVEGRCVKYETQNASIYMPCKGANSCGDGRVCVRSYCHEKCSKGQDCMKVDGINIVRKHDCKTSTSFSCAIHGDNSFCRYSVCADRAPGGKCDSLYNLDECAGDRGQGCFNAQCTPTCFSDGDCESGQMCDFYLGKHGICIAKGKSFPNWALALIVLGNVFLIAAVVVFIIRRRKKRKQKQAVTALKPDIRPEQSFSPYAPMASSSSGVNTSWPLNSQFSGQQTFAPSQQQPYAQSFVTPQSQTQQPFVPYSPAKSQQPFFPYSPSQPQSQAQAFVPYSPPKAQTQTQNSANTFASHNVPASAKTTQGDSNDLPNYSDHFPADKDQAKR